MRHDWRLAAVPARAEAVIRRRRDPAAARSAVIPAIVRMPATAGTYALREGVSLAFLIVIQLLPPRQRPARLEG